MTGLRAADPHLHTIVERAIAEGDLALPQSGSVPDPDTEGPATVDIPTPFFPLRQEERHSHDR
ncbi:hypothetical protein [Streptomyces sp. CoH27]|uniref:hypothetical protein n=1 Tax=Streptomyces sp. CoH27 TaxID=2875763 RepID=UPI001CD7B2F9|nr:hypothetical protein [Streptomyces sp. CoH27]